MKNLRVVFMGTPEFSVPILKMLIEYTNVIMVVTQPDRFVGRKKELTFSPVKKVALESGIKIFQPEKIRVEYEEIIAMNPDIIITCAYGQIIPEVLLEYPKYKCINVHGSLLPNLRGGAPIQRALMEGYKETGITIMYMAKTMDSGDMIAKQTVVIEEADNYASLHNKLMLVGRDLLLETLPNIISGKVIAEKQDEEEVTFARIIKREDERLSFNKTSREIYNHVRALDPIPGAYSMLGDKIVKIFKVVIGEDKTKLLPGEITNVSKEGIAVKTLDGRVIIKELMFEGKKRMEAGNLACSKDPTLEQRFSDKE